MYETSSKAAYIYSLNGKTENEVEAPKDPEEGEKGTESNPYTVAEALEVIAGLSDGATTSVEYYVKGIVANIDEISTTQYYNATYDISDDGATTTVLKVYRGKGLNGANFTSTDDLIVSDEVVVKGKFQKYVKNDVTTPEITGSSIVSLKRTSEVKPAFGASINSEAEVSAVGGTRIITVTGNVDWTASVTGAAKLSAESGTGAGSITVTIPANTSETESPEFTVTVSTSADVETKSFTFTVKQAKYVAPSGDDRVDVLDLAWTGVSGTNYASWTASGTQSGAQYAGQSAGGNESIQLRSNNNNSGIVSTTSGGKLTKIVVKWNSETAEARTLCIYGSNTAYTNPTDLYGDNKGELLGELVKSEAADGISMLEVEGDFKFVGLRSKSGAMYLSSIEITWGN